MKISVRIINRKNLSFLLLGIGFVGSLATNLNAQQRDPFTKPVVRIKNNKVTVGLIPKAKPAGPTMVGAPPIQSRIDGYRAVRQRCAELGVACPKPTSVLTLDEMQVTGIFRTPRGYAAMVEASPLTPKLSYTIYPGEKFYDGQLIAIEDTRLIFRRTTQMSDGKVIVASLDKVLRQENINDLASSRPDSQIQSSQPKPAATGDAATPQMSAEAVPMSPQKDAGVPVTETTVNPSGMQQNNAEPRKKPAAKQAVPAASVEVPPVETDPKADAVPVPSKAKAKAKAKTKKSS
jgi:hypothetical protein